MDVYTPEQLSGMLYGLRSMSHTESPDILVLLEFLTNKMRLCTEQFSNKQIAKSMHGLRRMNSYDVKVANLLILLGQKIERSGKALIPLEIDLIKESLEGKSEGYDSITKIIFNSLNK